jgi:serine/threonine protein kinase/tetratricopeptide (TPR) repeat protein
MPLPLNPDEFAELERLFHEALELPPPDRAAFVERLRASSPALADRLTALLSADAGGDTIRRIVSDEAQTVVSEEDPLVGERFGAYRLERVIGRGGMGAVYLGRRADGTFEQQVAVKTILGGHTSPHTLDRLRREREILARLDHPGIARLLDGGEGPQGVPYVVMEYVAGVPITRYTGQHAASVRRRLELFLELCDAVEFVHRNLIVHRDIKPGNVLVTAEGRVKLLDFGIARLTDEFEMADAATATGQRAMTPEYASPEQILGRPVTTAADIYALGVVLYELVTGERPLKFSSTSPLELAQEIVSRTPPLPSDAARRHAAPGPTPAVAPKRLARQLRGDLDRIVMMALRKEPDRRYASVAALAADVRAWLAGRPVAAQTDTWRYRTRKLVGRHPLASAAVLVVTVTVAGFTALTIWQGRVITRERDNAVVAAQRATATSDFLIKLFQAADPRHAGTRSTTAFDLLQAGVDNLRADTTLDPAVRSTLHVTLGLSLANLEAYDQALDSLRTAVAESEEAHGRDSVETAEALHRLGDVLRRMHRYDEAFAALTEALETRRRHIPSESREIADSYNNVAILAIEMGRYEESDRLQSESVAILERLPDDGSSQSGVLLNNLALLERRRGRYERALSDATRALESLRATTDRDSARLAQENIAMIRRAMGDVDGAERLFRSVRDSATADLGADHARVISTDLDIARCRVDRGEYDEVSRMYRDLERRVRKKYGQESVFGAIILRDRGLLDLARGRPAAAESLLREALAIHLRIAGPKHFRVPSFRRGLADALAANGKLDEAERQFRATLAILPDPAAYPHVETSDTLTSLGHTLRLAGRLGEARKALDEARRIVLETAGSASREMQRVEAESRSLAAAASGGGRRLSPP